MQLIYGWDVPSERWDRGLLSRCEHLMPVKQVGGMLAKVAESQGTLHVAHDGAGLSKWRFEHAGCRKKGSRRMGVWVPV